MLCVKQSVVFEQSVVCETVKQSVVCEQSVVREQSRESEMARGSEGFNIK